MSDYQMREPDEEERQGQGQQTDPNAGRGWAIAGIVSGVASFVLIPFIFGVVGIVLGIVARSKGAGTIAIVAIALSAVGLLVGLALNILVLLNSGALTGGG